MKGGVGGRKGDPDCNLNFPNCLRVSCPWNIDYCCLTGNRNSLVSFYTGLERSLYRSLSSVLEVTWASQVLWLPHRCICVPYLETFVSWTLTSCVFCSESDELPTEPWFYFYYAVKKGLLHIRWIQPSTSFLPEGYIQSNVMQRINIVFHLRTGCSWFSAVLLSPALSIQLILLFILEHH